MYFLRKAYARLRGHKAAADVDFPRLLIPSPLKKALLNCRHPYGSVKVINGEKAVCIYAWLGGSYMSLGGLFFEDHGLRDEAPVLVTDVKEIISLLVLASRTLQVSEILQLLPRRPKEAVSCHMCEGELETEFLDTCDECYGLGWCLPRETALTKWAFSINSEGRICALPRSVSADDLNGLLSMDHLEADDCAGRMSLCGRGGELSVSEIDKLPLGLALDEVPFPKEGGEH